MWCFIISIILFFTVFICQYADNMKKKEEKANEEYRIRMAEEEQKTKEYLERQERETLRILEQERQRELERHKLKEPQKVLKNEYNKTNTFYDEYIVFDLETTGLDACENEIIEIGAIKYKNGMEISTFHSYIKPIKQIPYEITELTGITADMVSDSEDAESVLQCFIEYIKESVLIAHNSDFDMSFLQTEIYHFFNYTLNNEVIDTLKLARKFLPNLNNHKLRTIKDYFKINRNSHNAIDDCYVTAELYKYCFDRKDIIISPFDSNIEFNQLEIKIFKIIKTILENNNLSSENIGLHRNSTYTDVLYEGYTMLRFKLKGKLTYWLVDMDLKSFSEKYKIDGIKESSKSEGNKVRVPIENIENIINNLEEYIITSYEKCKESKEHYEEWVKRGKPTTYSIMIEFENGKPVKKVSYD